MLNNTDPKTLDIKVACMTLERKWRKETGVWQGFSNVQEVMLLRYIAHLKRQAEFSRRQHD